MYQKSSRVCVRVNLHDSKKKRAYFVGDRRRSREQTAVHGGVSKKTGRRDGEYGSPPETRSGKRRKPHIT